MKTSISKPGYQSPELELTAGFSIEGILCTSTVEGGIDDFTIEDFTWN